MPPEEAIRRIAACACGRLTAVCVGEPEKVSLCHCRQCRKRTGSAFGVAVFYSRDRVSASGPAGAYERASDSGQSVRFQFCRTCGSTLLWHPARTPARVAVAYGAFADQSFPAPTQAVFEADGHVWARALAIKALAILGSPHHVPVGEGQLRP